MILSNEPGYYKTGAYGIRIENLVLVVEAPPVAGAEKPLNAFETLTLAPIDRRLVVPQMLTADERSWLDGYHVRVRETLSPLRRCRHPRLARRRDPPARPRLNRADHPLLDSDHTRPLDDATRAARRGGCSRC